MSKQAREQSEDSHIMFDTYKYIKELQGRGFKEDQAASIVHIVSRGKEQDLANLATKEQVKSLEKDIQNVKERMATKEDIANVRSELKEDIASLNAKIETLNTKIESVKFDLLKWVIPLFIALMAEIWFKK